MTERSSPDIDGSRGQQMSLNGGRFGGQCPSEPLSKGETLLINTLVGVLLALALGVVGYIGWLVVKAFI